MADELDLGPVDYFLVGFPPGAPLDGGALAQMAALVDAGASGSGDTLVAFAARRPSERGDRWQPRVVMREPSA